MGNLHRIYADESRQTRDQYMTYGGVIFDDEEDRVEVMGKLAILREDSGWGRAEYKWTKISPSNTHQYIRLVDYFFNLGDVMFYKSLILDTTTIDNKTWGKEKTFYTLYYHLLLYSLCKYLPEDNTAFIVLHRRTTSYDLGNLHRVLNSGIAKQYKCPPNLVKQLRSGDSIRHPIIQVVDVLTGAIGYELNGYHEKENASEGKIEVMNHIKKRAGLTSFSEITLEKNHKFSVWHFKFNR